MSDVGKTKKRELFTLKISVQYVQQAIVVIKEEGGQYNTHRYNAIIFKRRRTGAEFFVSFSFFHWLVRAISLGGTDGGYTLFFVHIAQKMPKIRPHIFAPGKKLVLLCLLAIQCAQVNQNLPHLGYCFFIFLELPFLVF